MARSTSTQTPTRASMETVVLNKGALLTKLTANRDAHREIFLKAIDGYQAKVVEELERALADAKAGRKFKTFIQLEQPEDHTEDYNRIIDSLEMSIFEEVELTMQEFDQYVRDNWGWKGRFVANSTQYGAGS